MSPAPAPDEIWVAKGGLLQRRSHADVGVPPTTNGGADPALWTLDFDEDFLSPASGVGFAGINTTRWNLFNNTSNSNENSYLQAGNVSVANSVLRILAKLESAGGRNYTSGYLTTNDVQGLPERFTTQPYFRALVHARCSFQQGMWCAPVWFRPSDSFGAVEIDLIETWGFEKNKGHYTLHTGTNYTTDHVQAAYTKALTDPEGWHTWVLEKTPNKIVMFCDGVIQKTFLNTESSIASRWATSFESGRRFDVRANLQVGGTYGGLPDSTTDWSKSYMDIDRIAIWRSAIY